MPSPYLEIESMAQLNETRFRDKNSDGQKKANQLQAPSCSIIWLKYAQLLDVTLAHVPEKQGFCSGVSTAILSVFYQFYNKNTMDISSYCFVANIEKEWYNNPSCQLQETLQTSGGANHRSQWIDKSTAQDT